MKTKYLYLTLAIIGAVIPYRYLIEFFNTYSFDLTLLIRHLFEKTASTAFTSDLIITAVVTTIFIVIEARRRKISYAWLCVLGTFSVGVSFGLPLFLYFREQTLENNQLSNNKKQLA